MNSPTQTRNPGGERRVGALAPFSPRVLRRLLMMAALLGFVLVGAGAVVRPYFVDAPPGDYATRQGDILLSDGDHQGAIERFERALAADPSHRGALMGKAIALLQSGRGSEAETVLTRLIGLLRARPLDDDPTGRGVLAAAYANRGILADREGRYPQALADYREALAIDAEAVEGPGLASRILYGDPRPSTVRLRAAYLERQLQLPPDRRLLSLPEADVRQRMHKP